MTVDGNTRARRQLFLARVIIVLVFAGWYIANTYIDALLDLPRPVEEAIYIGGLFVILAAYFAWEYHGARHVRARLAQLKATRPNELHYPVTLDPLWMPVGTVAGDSRPAPRLGYLHVGGSGLTFTAPDGASVLDVPWDELLDVTESLARGPIFEIVVSDGLTWSRWWFALRGKRMGFAAGVRRTRALVERIRAARTEISTALDQR